MKTAPANPLSANAVITRLSSLAPLGEGEIELIHRAARIPTQHRPHREVQIEGQSARQFFVLSGWVSQARTFADGRRQIINLLLPGDLFSSVGQFEPTSNSTIVTLSHAATCPAPIASDEAAKPGLAAAYRHSRSLREAYLFRHVARLGRLNAVERLTDWLLEIRDRLALADLVDGDRLALPLTQEALADTLGLTSVHVNRTLQAMRKDGLIDLRNGVLHLLDAERMAALVSYRPVVIGG